MAAASASHCESTRRARKYTGTAVNDMTTALITLAAEPDVTPAALAVPLPELADAEEAAAQSLRAAVAALTDGRPR